LDNNEVLTTITEEVIKEANQTLQNFNWFKLRFNWLFMVTTITKLNQTVY